jgi:phage shock protein A
MSLYQRARDILAAKANKAIDAAEKPDELLDLSYEDMLDQLTMVRRALVDLSASRKHIELQKQQFQHSVDHLDDQAKAALGQGNEALAREALSRKAAAQAQISDMESQHQELDEQEQKLEQTLSTLQKRVNDFRSQKEVIKAQYVTAQAETSVEGIPVGSGDSGESLQRALDKIATMQARAGATDELLQSGRTCSPPSSTPSTTRWCWCATSRSTRPASTTSSRSSATPTSATSRTSRARSPGCRSWPGWWTSTPGGRRSRSG